MIYKKARDMRSLINEFLRAEGLDARLVTNPDIYD